MGTCMYCKVHCQEQSLYDFKTANKVKILDQSQIKIWMQLMAIDKIPQNNFLLSFGKLQHPCFQQIKKDCMRTFPQLPFFGMQTNLDRFANLLKNFALYFPKVGYTQGINFIAGYLLICGFTDYQAFSMLIRIAAHQQILAIGLYEDGFQLNRLYCQVFWLLLNKKMPGLASNLRKTSLSDEMWIFQWFISFFLYSFPAEVVKPFWSYIIINKGMSIVLVALGVIKCLQPQLMRINSYDQFDFLQVFQRLKLLDFFNSRISIDRVIMFAESITQIETRSALLSTKCFSNQYRDYFCCQGVNRKHKWEQMCARWRHQRKIFQKNPSSQFFTRNQANSLHLQNIMIQKYKLYKSEYKNVTNAFRVSNFSIPIGLYERSQDQITFNQEVQSRVFRTSYCYSDK